MSKERNRKYTRGGDEETKKAYLRQKLNTLLQKYDKQWLETMSSEIPNLNGLEERSDYVMRPSPLIGKPPIPTRSRKTKRRKERVRSADIGKNIPNQHYILFFENKIRNY